MGSTDCKFGQICPGLNANEIQIPHDKPHKVSSMVKSHQNTLSSVKYEVLIKNTIILAINPGHK